MKNNYVIIFVTLAFLTSCKKESPIQSIPQEPFGTLLKTLTGHSAAVWSVVFTPDGQTLISGGGDNSIKLWRVTDAALVRTINDSGYVYDISISPDGQLIASATSDNSVRLWHFSNGTFVRRLVGHASVVSAVAFSPDGLTLVSGDLDGKVILWKVSDGSPIRTINTVSINAVAFSPDGNLLASGGLDKIARLWNTSDGSHVRNLSEFLDVVTSLKFSSNGLTIMSASHYGQVRLWNVVDGSLRLELNGGTSVEDIAFSPNDSTVASGGSEGVKFWRRSDGTLLLSLADKSSSVYSVNYSPDGTILASSGMDKNINLWQAK